MNPFSLWLIHLYRRYLSPFKGYKCAYAVTKAGSLSCSDYGLKIFARYEFPLAIALLRRRFKRCAGQVSGYTRHYGCAGRAVGCCSALSICGDMAGYENVAGIDTHRSNT